MQPTADTQMPTLLPHLPTFTFPGRNLLWELAYPKRSKETHIGHSSKEKPQSTSPTTKAQVSNPLLNVFFLNKRTPPKVSSMKNTGIKTKKKGNLKERLCRKTITTKHLSLIASENQKICNHKTRTEYHKKGLFKSRSGGSA